MKKTALILLVILNWWHTGLFAQNEKFKALFMYNFTKYIEWPQQARQGDFVIGVLGNSPIVNELEIIATKQKIGTQNIVIKTYSSVDMIDNCQILYLPPSKSKQLSSVLTKIGGKAILIITDNPGLALQGAAINYVSDGDKIKYEINRKNIDKSGLSVSSALLSLGVSVTN
jgi:hypothetical protein